MKKMTDKHEDATINVPRWDTSQPLFPDDKKGGYGSGKASAEKKQKTEKRGGDGSGEASAKKKQKTEKN